MGYPGTDTKSRFPRGKRGLKSLSVGTGGNILMSLPPREAWIEISLYDMAVEDIRVASPAGSVD